MANFDQIHPELQEGEVFLGNFSFCEGDEEKYFVDPGHYNEVGWMTKRMGLIAYNTKGEMLPNTMHPVFVRRWELERAGINVDEK